MSPQRIQLRRTKGWRKPEGAVIVSRPTKWGNPYRVVSEGGRWWVAFQDEPRDRWVLALDRADAFECAVQRYWDWIVVFSGLDPMELAGKDLACFCPLDQPCHGNILLELANQ